MKRVYSVFFIIFIIYSSQNISVAGEFFYDKTKAIDSCKEKWTERGELDESMFSYCMKKQDKGYKDALYLIENKYQNIPLIDQVLTYAMNRWLTRKEYDYNMVRFEIEQQSEGYLDVKWDLDNGKISDNLFNSCKNKWIETNEPLWRMVRYCTRK